MRDAIFATNDLVAQGMYDAAKQLGLKIPGDLAVAGFGDMTTSSLISPPLSTVKPPLDEMSEAAVKVLVDLIENNNGSRKQQVFKARLIIREST